MRPDENPYWREAPDGGPSDARDLLESMLSRPVGGQQGFSLQREVAARPFVAVGAALVAGFLLGSATDERPIRGRTTSAWLAPLDDELDMLKSAALAAIAGVVTENIREIVPGQTGQALGALIGSRLPGGRDANRARRSERVSGMREQGETSVAPNTSFATGAGAGALGYDSPPAQGGSVSLSNSEVRGSEHLEPYYPPGGPDQPIRREETPGKQR